MVELGRVGALAQVPGARFVLSGLVVRYRDLDRWRTPLAGSCLSFAIHRGTA